MDRRNRLRTSTQGNGAVRCTGKPPPTIVTFGRNCVLHIGGVEVQLHHFGKAYTDGASVVLFPDLKIAALGDLYAAAEPQPDFAAGGGLMGWPLVLAQVLKLDADLFMPSQGAPVTRVGLKARLVTLVARAGDWSARRARGTPCACFGAAGRLRPGRRSASRRSTTRRTRPPQQTRSCLCTLIILIINAPQFGLRNPWRSGTLTQMTCLIST